ncbi:MAG: hypothetical protein V1790_16175, partial [Planctomycetota bacterium]
HFPPPPLRRTRRSLPPPAAFPTQPATNLCFRLNQHRLATLGEKCGLAHYPSTVFRVPMGKVQLVLSGHTHGGQIRLPGLGCVWANDRIPRRMSRGLHEVAGTMIHVSPGIGVCLPIRIRVNCPAEVTVLTLVAVASDHEAVGSAPTEKEDRLVSGTVA